MKILNGDILQSKAQTLINPVNCVGIMGKGIVQEFKNRFPAMFQDYVKRCARKEVKLGVPYFTSGV
jgi:O-acetyl-ADP-ribose deacetylase (regulator of RNase III)